MSVDDRLAELRIVIPETTAPVANYVTARRSGNLLFLSGHLGKRDGEVVTGRVGDDVDTDTAYDLARRAAIDLLGTARAALGTLDTVAVVKLTGFVQQRARRSPSSPPSSTARPTCSWRCSAPSAAGTPGAPSVSRSCRWAPRWRSRRSSRSSAHRRRAEPVGSGRATVPATRRRAPQAAHAFRRRRAPGL